MCNTSLIFIPKESMDMKNLVNEEYNMKNWVNVEYQHEEFRQSGVQA